MAEKELMDPRVSSIAAGAKYKSMSPARLPITRSPCVTIPPGFSPSALLESPVLLTNVKAEPSPTTGSFNISSLIDKTVQPSTSFPSTDASNLRSWDRGGSIGFEFKPHLRKSYSSGLSSPGPLASVSHPSQSQGEQVVNSNNQLALSIKCPDTANKVSNTIACQLDEAPSQELEPMNSSEKSTQVLQVDSTEQPAPSNLAEKSAEDGYNWRKYGQKHVKGCEYPRSYYKCTHPNCQVKKQLERSHNGQITEIIYKGHHDHPKPQPNRRLAVVPILSNQEEEISERISSLIGSEEKLINAPSLLYHQSEPTGLAALSPASASDDDVEQSKICDDVADDDDPESKRRKTEISSIDANSIGKMNREPRVVVQTVSEVDILDDGYRWRKYGQKVVKGNPNPRSYYKCTSVGCPVRKHVERASHDPKAVITTYEGKHNHDVPVARTASHESSSLTSNEFATALPNHMPAALTVMMRNCNSVAISHPYSRPADNDRISLDLGVGINQNQDNTVPENQQAFVTNQNQVRTDMNQGNPYSALYASSRNGAYNSSENKGEVFSFSTPSLNTSSNVYYSSTGNLVMGP